MTDLEIEADEGPDTNQTAEDRDEDRKERRKEDEKKIRDTDAFTLAMQELKDKQAKEADDVDYQGPSLAKMIVDFLLMRKKKQKPVWRVNRRSEIESWVHRMRQVFPLLPCGENWWYRRKCNKKVKYVGARDQMVRMRDGMGVCSWPDPPWGGGESYYGMWREDQPNMHGLFRWFDGDMYMGEWVEGKMQGYGIYTYSSRGKHPNDRYEGGYFQSQRQGSGIYFYAGPNGGVYMGEWLRGRMHGHGLMVYPDGEYYLGNWKSDLKEGKGIYIWGRNAGEVAGDKYEGNFRDGFAHGAGRTVFSDGGWHKGRYVRGKMQGNGMMQTAEGWEYIGFWRDDELHGEAVCYYVYGATESQKTVQTYDNGELVSERLFESEKDWADLEAVGRAERVSADREADEAVAEVRKSAVYTKRAKQSSTMAREAAEEARFFVKASIERKEYLLAWCGMKHVIFPPD